MKPSITSVIGLFIVTQTTIGAQQRIVVDRLPPPKSLAEMTAHCDLVAWVKIQSVQEVTLRFRPGARAGKSIPAIPGAGGASAGQ